jgi:xanthine dehydrogenase accessory factor
MDSTFRVSSSDYQNPERESAVMREVIAEIEAWQKEGKSIAIATNVKMNGSSLRPLGAKMAMADGHRIAGSVTGGCIEGAVYEEAMSVLKSGQPKLLHYGVTSDQSPWEIGLSCGTSLNVFVETLDSPAWREIYPALKKCLEENQFVAVATVIAGRGLGNKMLVWLDGQTLGSLGDSRLDAEAAAWTQVQMQRQETGWTHLIDSDVFVDVMPPPLRLIVVGAVHIAAPLVTLAKALDFHTIVIDPREAFATRERFPHVDELITEWTSVALEKLHPDEGTYVACITHDPKLDNPALKVALASPARYVGVLGTRKKIPQRLEALREMGVTEDQLGRLHAPIGMNIGAILPEEIALSILTDMVSAQHGVSLVQGIPANMPVLELA